MSNVRDCKWKPPIKRTTADKTHVVKFPCRFPDEELTTELCTQCLLGDMYTMQYTQMVSLQKGFDMQQEMMAFVRNMTDDGSLDELK
jgi:hypothetical protein